MKVPEILLSGNHQEIRKWREHKALERTQKVRPDLLQGDEDGLT
jgi:tRNA (guanine37-N1)-methyltransferase